MGNSELTRPVATEPDVQILTDAELLEVAGGQVLREAYLS